MAKRVVFSIVCAGLGALVGLVIDFAGAGHWTVVAGSIAGASVPAFMGPPGK